MSNPNPSPSTRFQVGNPGGPGRRKGSHGKAQVLLGRVWMNPESEAAVEALFNHWVNRIKAGKIWALRKLLNLTDGPLPRQRRSR